MRKALLGAIIALLIPGCVTASQRVKWHSWRGKNAYENQKYKRAIKHLEAARKAGAEETEILYMLGTTHLYHSDYQEAARCLEEVVKNRPEDAEAWFRLGNAYRNLARMEDAARAYRKAVELKPDYLEAVEAMAMLYPYGGISREDALKLWKKAREMEDREEWIIRADHYIERLEQKGKK